MNNVYFCVDIGGTKTALALFDGSGRELFFTQFPTLPEKGAENLVARIYAEVGTEWDKYAEQLVCGVIACPGPLDISSGKIIKIATMDWQNIPVVSLFEQKFGIVFLLINDCNAGALGAYAPYADKGSRSAVYVSVSTGIGGGIILDGELYNGKGNAGEFGHLPVKGQGIVCACGKTDCLELYSSGSGMEKRYSEKTEEAVSCAEIAERARAGERTAVEIFRSAGEKLALALRSVVGVLDPDFLVFGGSVCRSKDLFLPFVKAALPDLQIRFASESGRQVLIGAFIYAQKTVRKGFTQKLR